jgi:hypothetical protein
VARDAAGGVGGADEGRGDLTVALALPYRKAVEMDVVRLHSGHGLVARESDRELHLILGHGLVADDQMAPTPGPPHVRSGCRDGNFPLRIA